MPPLSRACGGFYIVLGQMSLRKFSIESDDNVKVVVYEGAW